MKRMLIVVMVCIVLCLISTTTFAVDMQSTGERYISKVYPQSAGLSFILSGDKIIPGTSCNNRFIIKPEHPLYNTYVSVLLTAYSTGSLISVKYDRDTADGACSVVVDRFTIK